MKEKRQPYLCLPSFPLCRRAPFFTGQMDLQPVYGRIVADQGLLFCLYYYSSLIGCRSGCLRVRSDLQFQLLPFVLFISQILSVPCAFSSPPLRVLVPPFHLGPLDLALACLSKAKLLEVGASFCNALNSPTSRALFRHGDAISSYTG